MHYWDGEEQVGAVEMCEEVAERDGLCVDYVVRAHLQCISTHTETHRHRQLSAWAMHMTLSRAEMEMGV